MKGVTMIETQMLIHCLYCNNVWDIDHDPDSCTCPTDDDWVLIVVDDESDAINERMRLSYNAETRRTRGKQ